jgi:hypothetical protein
MPPLEKLSIKDLLKMFTYDKVFTFREIKDGLIIYQTDQAGLPYTIHFYINEFSNLEESCTISDITAAIDESKFFSVEIM